MKSMIRRILKAGIVVSLLIVVHFNASKADSAGDFQKNFYGANQPVIQVCASDTGYYVHCNLYMHYIEKSSLEGTILCAKMDCMHDDGFCNGFFPYYDSDIAYYNGSVYYCEPVERDIYLCAMGLDGTDRRRLFPIGNVELNRTGQFAVHRGFVYYLKGCNAFEISLSKSDEGEKRIGEMQNESHYLQRLWADGDYVYFMIAGEDRRQQLYQYDVKSKEFTLTWSVPTKEDVGNWGTPGFSVNGWFIQNGCIYYYLSGNGIWRYEIATKVNERLCEVTDPRQQGFAIMSEDYIFIDSGNTSLVDEDPVNSSLYQYTYDGAFIAKIPYGQFMVNENLSYFSPLAIDGDTILWMGTTDEHLERHFENSSYDVYLNHLFYSRLSDIAGGIHKLHFSQG